MKVIRQLEQEIALFGESGSGKTVLLSSFYGAAQEPAYLQKNVFHVIADSIGQGNRLHKNYLGMRDSALTPAPNRFEAKRYSFSIKFKKGNAKAKKSQAFDALSLVWHDYPGEWFEQDVSGPEEAQRRIDTFRSLLGSDVAFLLVDGQKLLDNAGEEARYLKSLLGNFRNGLLSLKDDLLEDGKPLVEFPRIWVAALSKSDLLPEMDVFQFRDLLISEACDELDELRQAIAGLVEGNEALSVGEDFMLLSSARFEPGRIEVTQRVGLDLILPLAAILPFERHVRWAEAQLIPGKLAENLLRGAGELAKAMIGRKSKAPGMPGTILKLVDPAVVDAAVDLADEKLRALNTEARANHDNLSATLTGFKIDLDDAEKERILLRSMR